MIWLSPYLWQHQLSTTVGQVLYKRPSCLLSPGLELVYVRSTVHNTADPLICYGLSLRASVGLFVACGEQGKEQIWLALQSLVGFILPLQEHYLPQNLPLINCSHVIYFWGSKWNRNWRVKCNSIQIPFCLCDFKTIRKLMAFYFVFWLICILIHPSPALPLHSFIFLSTVSFILIINLIILNLHRGK